MIIFFGFGILAIGSVMVWGGITGTLPAALAAVFDPSLLSKVSTKSTTAPFIPKTGKGLLQDLRNIANPAASQLGHL